MDKNKPPFRGASLSIFHLRAMIFFAKENRFIPKRSLDIGEIARLCHVACFWPGRRRGGLRRGVAGNRMRTEAGKMPGSLISPIRNGHGVSNDRFGTIWDKILFGSLPPNSYFCKRFFGRKRIFRPAGPCLIPIRLFPFV